MHALQLEQKLKCLNPRLYLGGKVNTAYNPELFSTGIYYKDSKIAEKIDYDVLVGEEFTEAKKVCESPDRYVSWCTYKWVPEGNWYNKAGRVLALGWRGILLQLSKLNLISLPKAKKIFQCPSLGESTYDLLNNTEKFQRFYAE